MNSGASSGSTARVRDSDSLESVAALPVVEEFGGGEGGEGRGGGGETELGPLARSDEELGSAVLAHSALSGIISADLASSSSSLEPTNTTPKTTSTRSSSALGGRWRRTRGRTPPPAIADDAVALVRSARASVAARANSAPTLGITLTSRAQGARPQRIDTQRAKLEDTALPDESSALVEPRRPTSEQGEVQLIVDSAGATAVEAESRRTQEELDKTRAEASQANRQHQLTTGKVGERKTAVARESG